MTPLFDMFPVDADEFFVMVVRVGGCMWERLCSCRDRNDAWDAVGRAKESGRYRVIGIQPQNSEMYPFQTHANQIVYEA